MLSGVAHLWDFSRNHVSQRSGTLTMKPLSSDEKLKLKKNHSIFSFSHLLLEMVGSGPLTWNRRVLPHPQG